jgi:hypothetical protein
MPLPERLSNGEYPTVTIPGMYPIIYITRDHAIICATCASGPDEDIADADVYWEGPAEVCEGCNVEIPSAYGDPDEEADA